MNSRQKQFQQLFHKTSKQLGNKKSPFSARKERKNSVWINHKYYARLKMLTIKHEHTSISYWADRAIKHAFNDGTIK